MKVYKCDGRECQNITSGIEHGEWLQIGSSKYPLAIYNNLKNRAIISMGNHAPIHFCSKECFIGYFIKEPKKKKSKQPPKPYNMSKWYDIENSEEVSLSDDKKSLQVKFDSDHDGNIWIEIPLELILPLISKEKS